MDYVQRVRRRWLNSRSIRLKKMNEEERHLSNILTGHVSAGSSGGARSAHRRYIRCDTTVIGSVGSSVVVGAVDGVHLGQVVLVRRDGAVVGVHGDLCTSSRSRGGHGGRLGMNMVHVVEIALVLHPMNTGCTSCISTSRWGVDSLLGGLSSDGGGCSCCGGWSIALGSVGRHMASASRTCDTTTNSLWVRDDGGMDDIGIWGIGASKGSGVVLVMFVVMVSQDTVVMMGKIILGRHSGPGRTCSKGIVMIKLLLVSRTVDRVSMRDGSITDSSACMKRHSCLVVVLVVVVMMRVTGIPGVQGIDGVLSSMVSSHRVDRVGSVAVECRAGLVRVVVIDVVIVSSATELVGQLGSLLLNLFHGRGLGGGGGGVSGWVGHVCLFVCLL
ncbi:MAG: hypothetical protein J3R72DRAFT_439609 [Linnemannia gamsii]|nr:MAG: hypothetical protein J3R72DRAFT_439609 [Linnemannia gamsii]